MLNSEVIWGLTIIFVFLSSIALIIPSIALVVRRLHDTGKSAMYLFIALIPTIGSILLLLFYAQESGPANMYGPAPNPDVNAYDSNRINML